MYGKKGDLCFCFNLATVTFFNLSSPVFPYQGAGGVVCVKSKQAVLIGVYDEGIQPGEATKVRTLWKLLYFC